MGLFALIFRHVNLHQLFDTFLRSFFTLLVLLILQWLLFCYNLIDLPHLFNSPSRLHILHTRITVFNQTPPHHHTFLPNDLPALPTPPFPTSLPFSTSPLPTHGISLIPPPGVAASIEITPDDSSFTFLPQYPKVPFNSSKHPGSTHARSIDIPTPNVTSTDPPRTIELKIKPDLKFAARQRLRLTLKRAIAVTKARQHANKPTLRAKQQVKVHSRQLVHIPSNPPPGQSSAPPQSLALFRRLQQSTNPIIQAIKSLNRAQPPQTPATHLAAFSTICPEQDHAPNPLREPSSHQDFPFSELNKQSLLNDIFTINDHKISSPAQSPFFITFQSDLDVNSCDSSKPADEIQAISFQQLFPYLLISTTIILILLHALTSLLLKYHQPISRAVFSFLLALQDRLTPRQPLTKKPPQVSVGLYPQKSRNPATPAKSNRTSANHSIHPKKPSHQPQQYSTTQLPKQKRTQPTHHANITQSSTVFKSPFVNLTESQCNLSSTLPQHKKLQSQSHVHFGGKKVTPRHSSSKSTPSSPSTSSTTVTPPKCSTNSSSRAESSHKLLSPLKQPCRSRFSPSSSSLHTPSSSLFASISSFAHQCASTPSTKERIEKVFSQTHSIKSPSQFSTGITDFQDDDYSSHSNCFSDQSSSVSFLLSPCRFSSSSSSSATSSSISPPTDLPLPHPPQLPQTQNSSASALLSSPSQLISKSAPSPSPTNSLQAKHPPKSSNIQRQRRAQQQPTQSWISHRLLQLVQSCLSTSPHSSYATLLSIHYNIKSTLSISIFQFLVLYLIVQIPHPLSSIISEYLTLYQLSTISPFVLLEKFLTENDDESVSFLVVTSYITFIITTYILIVISLVYSTFHFSLIAMNVLQQEHTKTLYCYFFSISKDRHGGGAKSHPNQSQKQHKPHQFGNDGSPRSKEEGQVNSSPLNKAASPHHIPSESPKVPFPLSPSTFSSSFSDSASSRPPPTAGCVSPHVSPNQTCLSPMASHGHFEADQTRFQRKSFEDLFNQSIASPSTCIRQQPRSIFASLVPTTASQQFFANTMPDHKNIPPLKLFQSQDSLKFAPKPYLFLQASHIISPTLKRQLNAIYHQITSQLVLILLSITLITFIINLTESSNHLPSYIPSTLQHLNEFQFPTGLLALSIAIQLFLLFVPSLQYNFSDLLVELTSVNSSFSF